MSSFIAAVRLLTAVPVGRSTATDARSIARSPVFFPIVGLAIGLLLAGADYGLATYLGGGVAAALVVGGSIAITGGLHLDGLADTADALGGGQTAERRLQIMRDPSIGTFGAAAVGMSLLIRWACVAALLGTPRFAAIAAAPLLGRWAVLLLVDVFRYARSSGLGSPYVAEPLSTRTGEAGTSSPSPAKGRGSSETGSAEGRGRSESTTFRLRTALGGVFTLTATFALFGPWGLLALGAATVSALLLGRYAASRLGGGITGDVYGAGNEVAEIAALVSLVALTHGDLLTAPVWI